MPPMLHVPFGELMSGGAQQLLPRDRSFRYGEGHHVLELIAETVGATQLIEGCACPHAAGKSLIEQPAIQNYVHTLIGCVYLHGAERVVPLSKNIAVNLISISRAVPIKKVSSFFFGFGLPQEENNFHASAGAQLDDRLQDGARIQGRACLAAKRTAGFQRRGAFRTFIAPEEFRTIGSEGRLASSQIGKSDTTSEVSVPCAACEERAGCRIHFADDVGSRRRT